MNQKITELSSKFLELRTLSKAKAEELKKIDAEWTETEAELQSAMIEEGCKSIKLAGMGTFMMRSKNYLSVNGANKEPLFFPYLREIGHDSILKLDVHAGTLGAFLDAHFEELKAQYMEKLDLDPVEARDKALEFLKEKGVTYFVKRDIAFKKGE